MFGLMATIPSSEELIFLERNRVEKVFLRNFFPSSIEEIFHREMIFVNFQIFFRSDDEDGGEFFPAELSIMKYSLISSVVDEFFTFVKPDRFPLGYVGEALRNSRETHQIPPFDFLGAEENYWKIFVQIRKFFSQQENPKLVFCNAFERERTLSLLNWLLDKASNLSSNFDKEDFQFSVCSFESLVVFLLETFDLGKFSPQIVREQLQRPLYTFQIKQRCLFHETLGIHHCSRTVNHAFRSFLDAFIRSRFLEQFSNKQKQKVRKLQRNFSLFLSFMAFFRRPNISFSVNISANEFNIDRREFHFRTFSTTDFHLNRQFVNEIARTNSFKRRIATRSSKFIEIFSYERKTNNVRQFTEKIFVNVKNFNNSKSFI